MLPEIGQPLLRTSEKPDVLKLSAAQSKELNRALHTGIRRLQSFSSTPVTPERIEKEVQRLLFLFSRDVLEDAFPETWLRPLPAPPVYHFRELKQVGWLGVGGFAKVELHFHKASGKTYAVKTLSKIYAEKTGMMKSLQLERLVLDVVKSPFVVNFYGSYNLERTVCFLLEPFLGGELYSKYRANEDWYGDAAKAKYYTASIAMGLRHVHAHHVILRGVKPEDCVLDSYGHLKMVDMGLGCFIIGKTYTTCGTPDYFPPEVIQASGQYFPSDWWCLGVMLFELLSEHSPFESAYPMQIYSKVIKGIDQIPFPESIPANAKEFISNLLKPCAEERLPIQTDGWEKLKACAWYADFDWIGLENQTLVPPYVPACR